MPIHALALAAARGALPMPHLGTQRAALRRVTDRRHRSLRGTLLGLAVALLGTVFGSDVAHAEPPYPVTLNVAGNGKPVRVVVFSRSLAGLRHIGPCDDGTDVSLLFDEMVDAGTRFTFRFAAQLRLLSTGPRGLPARGHAQGSRPL
jgi:hypothetical protein